MAITKIGSRGIADGAVAAADFAPGTITDAKLAGSIPNSKLSNSTITVGGTSTALGATSTPSLTDWQSVVTADGSTTTTMVSGRGYFIDTSSATHTVTLPSSANIGDFVSLKDYAETWDSNNCTVARNGHKINSHELDAVLTGERQSVTFVYVDATRGWLPTQESTVGSLKKVEYIAATGGTVATSGDFKIHSFTGDGNFVVSNAGNPAGSNKVSYLVVAGGGGGGVSGGGAGGFREGKTPAFDTYTSSPAAAPDGLPVSATTYPITIGGGGTGIQPRSTHIPTGSSTGGNGSVFSTITSTGGGGGANDNPGGGGQPGGPNGPTGGHGGDGGSGGGMSNTTPNGFGSGNTPPTTPPQGNPGGPAPGAAQAGTHGGGGAGEAGDSDGQAAGGDGMPSQITGSAVEYAGGGGGGQAPYVPQSQQPGGTGGGGNGAAHPNGTGGNGSANTGGGAGGGSNAPGGNDGGGGTGGSGIVIIRYKYQNQINR